MIKLELLVKLEFANLEGTPRLSHTSKSNNGVTFLIRRWTSFATDEESASKSVLQAKTWRSKFSLAFQILLV